jgi:hypothetical protein
MASLADERRKKNYVNMNKKTLEPLDHKPSGPFTKRAVSLGRRRENHQTRNLQFDLQAAKAMFQQKKNSQQHTMKNSEKR